MKREFFITVLSAIPLTFNHQFQTGKMPKVKKMSLLSPSATEKSSGIAKKKKIESIEPEEADSSIVEEKTLPKSKESSECQFSVGQLAWALVGNYPYWPCVVTLDPTSQIHAKPRCKRRRCAQRFHTKNDNSTFLFYFALQHSDDLPEHSSTYNISGTRVVTVGYRRLR